MNQGGHKRTGSFELLRVLCMFMVCMLHFVWQSGSLWTPGRAMTPAGIAGGLLESCSIVSVNVYVLISGYFLCRSPFRIERPIRLILQVLFYTLLIPVVLQLLGISVAGTDLWTRAQYFLPISMNHYWFATSYVLMYLFSPLLNAAVQHLTRRGLQVVIGSLMLFSCILESFSPVRLNIDQAGYDFGWFLVLYLIAAYIRLYGARRVNSGRRAMLLYGSSAALIFVLYLVLAQVNLRTGGLQYYSTVMFHYNTILCLAGALGLFLAFTHVNIPEGKFNNAVIRIAPLTFGVYLIHQHVDVRDRWYGLVSRIIGTVDQGRPLRFLAQALAGVALVYLVCMAVDAVRKWIFDLAGRALAPTRAARWCQRVDLAFDSGNHDTVKEDHSEKPVSSGWTETGNGMKQ